MNFDDQEKNMIKSPPPQKKGYKLDGILIVCILQKVYTLTLMDHSFTLMFLVNMHPLQQSVPHRARKFSQVLGVASQNSSKYQVLQSYLQFIKSAGKDIRGKKWKE